VEKVALALVSVNRKMKSYFQAYQVIVLTYQHDVVGPVIISDSKPSRVGLS
jgi:hypothetical protein